MASRRQPRAIASGVAIAVAALLACLLVPRVDDVALGESPQTLTLNANLTPNVLGMPTNLSTTMAVAGGVGVPKPASNLRVYGPADLRLDIRGLATCEPKKLETDGPNGCPAESRVGFGGGVGVVEFAGEPVREPFTLDFFLAPREGGHLTILIFASAFSPVPLQLVLRAREVHGPRPYGFGLAVEVPPISTVPGAANASVETGYVSIGGSNIAYYRTLHGVRRLVHVKGLISPSTCPRGGFPFEAIITFEDGSTSTGRHVSPCPHRRR